MPIVIKTSPTLYDIFKAEGIEMPPETVDVSIEFPVDGTPQMSFRTNLYGDRLCAVGRALVMVGISQKED